MADDIVLRLLGPVRLRGAAGGWSAPARPQQRLVLAVLALHAGRVVPVTELVETLWGQAPPPSARVSLQALVTRLRQALAGLPGGGVHRCGDGYRLPLPPAAVDLHRFRSLARTGRAAADEPAAVAAFDAALALWRGPALADVPETARVSAIRTGLADEHLSAASDRIGCLLRSGREREAAAELPGLLAAYPLAERLAGMLMLALERLGARGDALRVFRETRARLAAELGVEPGPELQQLHQRVLAGDPGGPAARAPGPAARAPGPAAPDGRSRAGKPRVVPRQLPAAAADFAGRAPELAALTRLAAPSPGSQAPGSQGPGAAAPVVISGTAGVGKTTLALHWASRAAGDFPDGQLYLDLRGYGPDPGPVPPGQALRGLLAALGVPPARITGPPDRQAALYRSLLAGRRMLVVLDNARDERQVRPLLPGGAACRVLITSRSQLTGLLAAEGARLLSLDVMSEADARQLLARKLGQERARAEPAAAGDLARL
ncbi:MAG: winged helix-turn-helix domain-containing protein, partial [Actinobacteria bacterium]|nr:winged helix-turn-helix domain-containing protein [Actinomycetota bacterium]